MKVAFLGTGLMGLPMAQKLLEARVQLIAYNR
ncbi:NAD(P)-binding domain-containing protein, partial [Fischerella thermalis]